MSLGTSLKMYSLGDLLKDPEFRRRVCLISKQCTTAGGTSSGTLQSVTTGTGNNITSNVVLLTGFDQFSTDNDGLLLADSGIIQIDSTAPSNIRNSISLGVNETAITYRDIAILSLSNLVGVPAVATFKDPNGNPITVSGGDAVQSTQFVTLQQVQEVVDHPYIGGQNIFTADNTTTVFNIIHNLGSIPSYFTLTTTTPITLNHLNRTVTFPDNNTMRITFTNPPLTGEDVNYVWIVYK